MFEGLNKNENLWKLINFCIQELTEKFDSTYDCNNFQFDFHITQNCWQDNSDFINVGEITIPFSIHYLKGRFDNKPREWKKYVSEVEKKLCVFFPNFKVPEQVFLAKSNPLTNSSPKPVIQMDRQESSVLSCEQFLQIVGKTTKNEFIPNLKFKLFINTDDVEFSITPKIGLNFIEDECSVTFEVKIQAYICSQVEYCKFVLNLEILSPSIYTEYLKKQFSAYTADSDYPPPQINIYKTFSYPFNTEQILDFDSYYLNEADEIVFIPKPNLPFESYIKQSLEGYDESKREIVKPYTEIRSIQNKIISIDTNTKNIVFTDCLGKIDFVSYSDYRKLTTVKTKAETVLNKPMKAFRDLISILRSYQVRPNSNVEQTVSLKEFLDSYDKQQLFDVYKKFEELDLPLKLKLTNKFFLYAYLFFDTLKDENTNLSELTNASTFSSIKNFPVSLSNFIRCDGNPVIVDQSGLYEQEALLYRIGVLLGNGKAKKSLIVTKDTMNVFNRLKSETINPVVLDRETLVELNRLFGQNLIRYFQGLKSNTPVIADPEVFEASDVLGDVSCYLGSSLYQRNFVLELFENTCFDSCAVFLNGLNEKHFKDCLTLCSGIKYVCFSSSNKNNLECLKKFSPVVFTCEKQNMFPVAQPDTSIACYAVEQDTNEYDYYLKLLSEGNALFDKDSLVFKEMKDDGLSNLKFTDSLNQKCFGFSNLFLNYPDFELFDYVKTLPSEYLGDKSGKKLQAVIKYLTIKYFGGVIEGELQQSRLGKTVVLFSNKLLAEHFENKLREHFANSNFCNIVHGVKCFSVDSLQNDFYSLTDFDEVVFFDYNFDRDLMFEIFKKLELVCCFSETPSLKISLFYNKQTTEETFLNTMLSVFKNGVNRLNDSEETPVDYSSVSVLRDCTQEIKSKMSEINFGLIKLRKYLDFYTEKRKQAILSRYGYSISTADLLSLSTGKFTPVADSSPRYLIPFKNFMKIDGLLAQQQNLNFFDQDGKPASYDRESPSKICLTEIGYGEITNDTNKQDVVDVFGFKKSVFDSTVIFTGDVIPQGVQNTPLFIDPALLSIQDTKPSENNTNKSTEQIKVNCNYINGSPCLFSTGSSLDLSVLGFNYFNNVFVLEVTSSGEFETYANQLKSVLDEKQIKKLTSIYEQFIKNKNLVMPTNYNFLVSGNIPSDSFKVFPTIIGTDFYIFINGIFYQKQAYKLSKKLPLNMIQTFYFIKENNLQALKQDFYKVMKTVDVLNAQDCIDFFSKKPPTFVPVKFEETPNPVQKKRVESSLKNVKVKLNPLFAKE